MNEILVLLFLSSAMLIGCYMAGMIPLIVSLSEDKLQIVSVMGAGLLVGTALAVIIPEGVNTLYSSQMKEKFSKRTDSKPSSNTATEKDMAANAPVQISNSFGLLSTDVDGDMDTSTDIVNTTSATVQNKKQLEALHKMHEKQMSTESAASVVSATHTHSSEVMEPHSVIGVALVLGFIFMLLIDQISSSHGRIQAQDPESTIKQDRHKITATIGLVVHAAADGIALGAAVTTSHTDIEMIVFTAIMLHKAPAAFGLVTFLMHEGLDRTKIRKHLLVFALAAPALAILTYFGISQSTKERLSSLNATGIAMLFSAGTFLYVATVHVLPEIQMQSHRHSMGDGSSDTKGFRKIELLALVVGGLLPLLLSVNHHH